VWWYTIARCCSACLHSLHVMIMLSTHMSCRHLGHVRACLGNTRASLHAVATKPSSISAAHGPWRVIGHMSAPKPTTEVGAGRYRRARVCVRSLLSSDACPMLRDTWQHRTPPVWRGGFRASRHIAAPESS
jgi:hypothetical protein